MAKPKKRRPVRLMTENQKCLDCEDVIADPEFGGGGSPMEAYEEGWHLCSKRKPRVVTVTSDVVSPGTEVTDGEK